MRIKKSWVLGAVASGLALAATASMALPRDMTIIDYYSDATHQEQVGTYVEFCSGHRNTVGTVTAYTETMRHRCYSGIDYDLLISDWYKFQCATPGATCYFD
ncbi:DUF6289 family protein [Brevundimonas sp. M20]|jgi:hypothetical protein|uniref:DUF6289 family protein n=1 Tax=Brevundimonas sp. M20 TaxID=2591463 RepID=UPI001146E20A|nr:DUF6289 family protein [Brevundimonas sp. M20]QDH74124.1 hypothetical protein FKQ52_12260 [Brevundimonas sp. M20]